MSPKLILTIVLAAIIVLTILWWLNRDPKITAYPTSGTTIVSFGDSLVEGVGTTAGNDFTSLLSKRINQPISNLGVSGDTSADGLARIDDLFEEDPKIVILCLGGNDTLKRVPVDTTYANLDTILKRITERGAGVVLLGIPGGLYGSRYDDMYETLAEKHGVAYVPGVMKGMLTNPDLMSDSIHPNDAGHLIMADRIEPLLRQVLAGPR